MKFRDETRGQVMGMLEGMNLAELEYTLDAVKHELAKRKLNAYNQELADLIERAKNDGISFVLHESPGWCTPLDAESVEAAC